MIKKVRETAQYLKGEGFENIDFAVILGTGLGQFVKEIKDPITFDYEEIPNFTTSTVEFHKGKLIFGTIGSKKILAMQGRFHYYEGYDMQQITFPIRVMKELGVKKLIVSNASGAINKSFKKGELMLLTDHINLLAENPLIGKNNEEWGPRFPDMGEPYSAKMNNQLKELAVGFNINLHHGIYAAVQGPNLETAAEYRYLGIIGADAVGMSTVPEVIVANHAGIECCAISVLTDECDPDNLKPVDISEIIEIAGKAEPKLIELVVGLVDRI
tara:strand:- start:32514 stop:33326 length:813 start_codon:yes stop_codon:yes gene_type:complete